MDSLLYLLFYFALQNFQQDRLIKSLTALEGQNVIIENTGTATVRTSSTFLPAPHVEPYVIHWSNEVQMDENVRNANQRLILYLNQITFLEENWEILFLLNKHKPIQEKRIYDINALITYKNDKEQSFYKKFLKTIQNISLTDKQAYTFCYKYLFQLLLKYPIFKEQKKEIKTFQNLFENSQLERKDLIFSYWFVITFPDASIEDFLKYSIKYIKEKIYNDFYLRSNCENALEYLDLCITPAVQELILKRNAAKRKLMYAFEFMFTNKASLNPNTSLILVKILQYLDKKDTANKEEIMSFISHCCNPDPINSTLGHVFSGKRNGLFYQEVKWEDHKLVFIYYKLPGTEKIIAITEASYLKELLKEKPNINVGKIYYGLYNFACIVLTNQVLSPKIQPLVEEEIEQLDKIYKSFILINPNSLHITTQYYYTPQQSGVAFIMSEDVENSYSLKALLDANKKIDIKSCYSLKTFLEANKKNCYSLKILLDANKKMLEKIKEEN